MTSSGEFIECTECGKYNYGIRDTCWLCNARLDFRRIAAGPHDSIHHPASDTGARFASDDGTTLIVGSVVVVFLFAGLILNGAWGLAFMLLVLLLPAARLTYSRMAEQRAPDESTAGGEKRRAAAPSTLVTFFMSLAGVIVALVAASTAFCVTCFAGYIGGAIVSSAAGAGGDETIGWGLLTGSTLGLVAAVSVAYLLTRLFRWRRG